MYTEAKTKQSLRAENAELRARLEEAEETLSAIRSGEVDALIVGEQIYMLASADAASNRFRGEVLAQVNDVVIAVDNDNRVTYLNPAAERQYGFDASSVLGCGLDEVLHYRWLHPDDEAAAQMALSDTGVWRGGNIHVKRNGEEIHVESTVNVLRDDSGAAIGLLAIIRDITERKQWEDALQQAHDELEVRVRERTLELAEANVSLKAELRERHAAEVRVRSLLRQIVTVQEEERGRIARELHDTLGQQLAALQLSIDMLKSKADNQVRLYEEAERIQTIFDKLNSDIDFLAWELRPAALDQLGLNATLQNFVREWSEHFQITAEYSGYGLDGARLPPEVETNLYRIIQEALQNVFKHSGADHVSVLLNRQDGQALLIVEDNGKGYDPEGEVAPGSDKGMGVVNMRERAALVGGSLEIESAPGESTTIFVRVPLARPGEGGEPA